MDFFGRYRTLRFIFDIYTSKRKQARSLILPAMLITHGFVSLASENLQSLDRSIKEEIRESNPMFHTNVDDYLQYAPAIAVYGLNAVGVRGQITFVTEQ